MLLRVRVSVCQYKLMLIVSTVEAYQSTHYKLITLSQNDESYQIEFIMGEMDKGD